MAGRIAAEGTLAEIAHRANLRYSTVEEAVTAALREAIITGVLKPGQRLRQAALAKELNTSRVPVTAALHTLEAEGLVDYAPHRGATVRVIEPEELEETYQLRILLETFALRLTIERITPAAVDELAELAKQLDGEDDPARRRELTDRFYQRVYTAAHCPLTAAIVGRLRTRLGRYWMSVDAAPHRHSMYNVLTEAIRAKDSDRAEQWTAEHLTAVSSEIQQLISARRNNAIA